MQPCKWVWLVWPKQYGLPTETGGISATSGDSARFFDDLKPLGSPNGSMISHTSAKNDQLMSWPTLGTPLPKQDA